MSTQYPFDKDAARIFGFSIQKASPSGKKAAQRAPSPASPPLLDKLVVRFKAPAKSERIKNSSPAKAGRQKGMGRQSDRRPGYISIKEASAKSGVTRKTIRRWIKRLDVPTTRPLGNRIDLIKESDLRKIIKNWKEIQQVGRDPTSVSPNQAAKILNVTGEAVKQWIYSGHLKATKLPNGYWRIKHEDLKAYLETRRRGGLPKSYAATCDTGLAERALGIARELGHETGSVTSTSDALKQFIQCAPNLLLVDLATFPEGWTLIKEIRSTRTYGAPKILLVSKEPLGEKETGDALRLGINGCLVGEVADEVLAVEMRALQGR